MKSNMRDSLVYCLPVVQARDRDSIKHVNADNAKFIKCNVITHTNETLLANLYLHDIEIYILYNLLTEYGSKCISWSKQLIH